jgi:hypothetical protein
MFYTHRLKTILVLALTLAMSCHVPSRIKACCVGQRVALSDAFSFAHQSDCPCCQLESSDGEHATCCSEDSQTSITCDAKQLSADCCQCCTLKSSSLVQAIRISRNSRELVDIDCSGLSASCFPRTLPHQSKSLGPNRHQFLSYTSSKTTCSRLSSWQC